MATTKLLSKLNSKWQFAFYLWYKLPAAFYCGVRLQQADLNGATATVPFKRRSQNPFGSTYFACLAMAAELSTGVLCLLAASGIDKKVSMLVVSIEGAFDKKATGITFFTCNDGQAIAAAMQQAHHQPTTITCISKGYNAGRETVATFKITWSFKIKNS